MLHYLKNKKLLFIVAAIVIILLNIFTFSVAYPTLTRTLNFGKGDEPRDFSVYYLAAWRLLHDPSHLFTVGNIANNGPQICPSPTPFKYLPSFLVLISPLTSLSYYQAFWVFDAIQFVMLPAVAFMLYALLEKKNTAVALAIFALVLVMPYPQPGNGLSTSYFMSWAEGQAKILLLFLLLLSFYLGSKGKPVFSGVIFAFSAFDPRFALLGLPLFLFYNQGKLKTALLTMVGVLLISNIAMFYPGVLQGFSSLAFGGGYSESFYTPSWIPLTALLCLMAVDAKEMSGAVKQFLKSRNRT
jgi:hypothetical protein